MAKNSGLFPPPMATGGSPGLAPATMTRPLDGEVAARLGGFQREESSGGLFPGRYGETYYRRTSSPASLFAANARRACEEADAALENPTVAQPLRKLPPPVVQVLEPKRTDHPVNRRGDRSGARSLPSGNPILLIQGRHDLAPHAIVRAQKRNHRQP